MMLKWTCIVVLFIAATTASDNDKQDWLDVKISQGVVRGHKDTTDDLYVFYNIPYATAPTGADKFKAPLPPPTWTETYDAIDKGVICPQFVMQEVMPENLVMQEDCLITNIYVPNTRKKNLSVLVNVHGGAFQLGYGDWLKPKNLMKNKDIIVVNFNYRLGVYGFLCLGTEDVPGNAGMKDQVTLLHWVQQNIAAFGGNPNDVTINGQSAGSASVDLLMISKSTDGLIHKVIPESGGNLAVFATQSDPLQVAKNYATELNFKNVDNIYALEKFYKTLSSETLKENAFKDRPDSPFLFVPCLERDTGDGAFLTEAPLNILRQGNYKKLPLLYGYANMEGLIRVPYFDTEWRDKMNAKFSDFLPINLGFETESEKEEVAKQIKEFYFGDKSIDKDNIIKYIDYFSDTIINYAMLWAVKLHVEADHDQVYLYEYSFVDEDIPVIPHTDNIRGATHCAQSMAVNDGKNLTHISEDDITPSYAENKKIIREMWHNFITTGKPVPKGSSLPTWPASGGDRSPHMSFGEKTKLYGTLLEESSLFWDGIYEKYYRMPVPPPQPPARSHAEL